MAKRVIVAGGGIAGSLAAKLLEDDFQVTLIDSKEFFEFRWATLRALVEPSIADKIIFRHDEYLKKATVKVGVLTGVTPSEVQLEDGTTLPYDFLVITTGSKAEPPVTTTERQEWFAAEAAKIKAAKSILIVGGGPVGVELAAEIATDLPTQKVTLVHGGERLLEYAKPKAAAKALKWLTKHQVEVILQDRVLEKGEDGRYATKGGRPIEADYVFWATGSRPNGSWLAGLPDIVDGDGLVKVGPHLQVEGYPNVFALGDITNIKELKQGYFAQIHAQVAAFNIKKIAKQGDAAKGLKKYVGGPAITFVSLGRANGVAQLPFGTFMGWMPTSLKSKGLFISQIRTTLGLPK